MQNTLTPQTIYKTIPQLKISPKGQFKYILIKGMIDGVQIGVFVRGDQQFGYHADNFDQFFKEVKRVYGGLRKKQERIFGAVDGVKLEFVCVGGGRIQHHYEGQKCSIYGYSQSYGYVDHNIAKKIISTHLGYPISEIKLDQKDY